MVETLLQIRNLRVEATSYPPGEPPKDVVIVDDVSLDLAKGRVLGLIGESGAGKSTIGLTSLCYGRGGARITGGTIVLNGRDIRTIDHTGLRQLRGSEVAYVAQSAAAAFNPSHRLLDQVIEVSVNKGIMSRKEAAARAVDREDQPACRLAAHDQAAADHPGRDRLLQPLVVTGAGLQPGASSSAPPRGPSASR